MDEESKTATGGKTRGIDIYMAVMLTLVVILLLGVFGMLLYGGYKVKQGSATINNKINSFNSQIKSINTNLTNIDTQLKVGTALTHP
jgi:predicted PurR-regulated permease PerM